jgi:uncharacterized membrane protein
MKHFALRRPTWRLSQLQIAWILLVLAMLIYAIVMSYESVLRYDTFKATAFDLGNLDQVLWNTIHGRLFQFTNQGDNWYGPPTRLAIHFEPIILPLSLLYAFGADPRILLVFQTLALAVGALPVFLLTRKYLPTWPLLAVAMAGAYLVTPALLGLNIFDFHPVSLATPCLLFALLALTYRRHGWVVVACVLAAATKEDIPFVVAAFGLLAIWKYRAPRLGTLLFIGGMIWGVLAFTVIIPHFYPGGQHNNFWYRYAYLGSTPGRAVINILLHPWVLLPFFSLGRFYYVANLFRGTGFLALLAPEWLLPALFNMAVNLLSSDSLLYTGVYQYNAPIIPFIIMAAIHGSWRLVMLWRRWRGQPTEDFYADILRLPAHTTAAEHPQRAAAPQPAFTWSASPLKYIAALLSFWSAGVLRYASAGYAVAAQPMLARSSTIIRPRLTPLMERGAGNWQRFSERMSPLARDISPLLLQWLLCLWLVAMSALNFFIMTPQLNVFWANHTPGSREQHIEQLLAMIPPGASVSAGTNLNPHLTERQYVTIFPAITFSLPGKNTPDMVQYIIVDLDAVFPEDKVQTANMLNQLYNSKQYRILAQAEGVILLVRRSP